MTKDKNEKKEYRVQYGSAEFVGIINGIDKVKEEMKKEKDERSEHTPYREFTTSSGRGRSIEFNIKTSETSTHRVKVTGYTSPKVILYGRKGTPNENKTKELDWSKRYQGLKDYTFGKASIGVSTGIEDNKNKIIQKLRDDAIDFILDNYEDGDSVRINADIQHRTYNGKNYTDYNVSGIYFTINPIDFSAENFTPKENFKQNLTFTSYALEEDSNGEKKHLLNAKIVTKKDGTNSDVVYTLTPKELMVKNFKRFATKKPGSTITVCGRVINEMLTETIQVDDAWGVDAEAVEQESGKGFKGFNSECVISYALGETFSESEFKIDELNEINISQSANDNNKDDFNSFTGKTTKKAETATADIISNGDLGDDFDDLDDLFD